MVRTSLPALLLFASLASAQVPPEKSMATMKVAPDLKVELFASEPMLINPTSMDVDHKGRVWIAEAVNYRQQMRGKPPIRKEGDRIVVLIDKTGEGKATEAVTFYQSPELMAPLGVCVVPYADGKGQKVFVAQSPNIWVFEDRDGDLKADGPPKILLHGFGGIDHDHGVHGLSIGPDGKLYFTVGDQGVKDLYSSDGKGRHWTSNTTDCRAGTVWRCEQDGTNLELVAHNFRNNYECCVNSFGEIWLSDNDDDGNQQTRICYVMPGGNYGYHPRGPGQSHWHEEQPGIVHKVLRTGFGSPTGICFYEGNLMPKRFHGELLHCDAGPREVRLFTRKPQGAGYELEKEVILTSSDTWFRPSDICVAPDGSIFVCDWYDPGVGGHGMGDTTRGRVYRITPKESVGYKVPEVKFNNRKDLLSAIGSPNLSTRSMAYSFVARQPILEGLSTLVDLIDNSDDFVTTRLGGIYSSFMMRSARDSDGNKGKDAKTLAEEGKLAFQLSSHISAVFGRRIAKLKEPDRVAALRLMESLAAIVPSEGNTLMRFMMDAVTKSPSPQTVSESALWLQNQPLSFVNDYFWTLAKLYDGQDRFYLAALNIACGTDPARRDAILADFDKQFPEWNDKVADLVWELRPKAMLPKLDAMLSDAKLTPAQKSRIVDILAASDEANAGKSLMNLLARAPSAEVRDRVLENLKLFLPGKWASLRQAPEMAGMVSALLKDKETAVAGLGLIAAAKRKDMLEKVESVIADKGMPLEVRRKAVLTLGDIGNDNAIAELESLLKDKDLAVKAVESLGQFMQGSGRKEPPASAAVLKLLKQKLADKEYAAIHATIVGVLAGTRPGTQYLIDAQTKKELPPQLVAEAGRFARNTPFPDLRNKALIAFPALANKLDVKALPPIPVLAQRSGNAERGMAVLASSLKGETQCLRCHMVRGSGGSIGPDLSMIGKKASKENLYESIFTPSKAIADQYIQWQITTESGQSITGLLVNETETDLTLRDANGKDTVIPVKSVEQRKKSLVSLMPENLMAAMTEGELVDLVEYLMTLKTPSLTPDQFHIVGPFPNDESDSGLKTAYEPEKGPIDLGAKYKGKEGEVSWKTVKPSAGGFFDLKAHYAPKSDQIASYVYQVIESPKDQPATLLLGHDDGMKVWLNGKEVYSNEAHGAAVPESGRATVNLKKGPNAVLMKIVNGGGDHGFYFALTGAEDVKVAGKR